MQPGAQPQKMATAKMQSIKYYSALDCRSGMLITILLYRMGCLQLVPMFSQNRHPRTQK